MAINYSNFGKLIKTEFEKANSEVLVLSPFCTSEAADYLFHSLPKEIKITIVLRWNKQDIISGFSDLDVAKLVIEKGGRVFRNQLLHAKIYMIDKDRLLFGSANMTRKGLGMGEHANNIECLSGIQNVSIEDIFFINTVIRNSQQVSYALLEELKKQLQDTTSSEWKSLKIDGIVSKPQGIFVNDFLFCKSPGSLFDLEGSNNAIHDMLCIGFNETSNKRDVANLFANSRIIEWLDKKIGENMSFGELSKIIHDSLLDDPKPYRKNIKELQQNLFTWIEELLKHKFQISIPEGRYSQVIRKIN